MKIQSTLLLAAVGVTAAGGAMLFSPAIRAAAFNTADMIEVEGEGAKYLVPLARPIGPGPRQDREIHRQVVSDAGREVEGPVPAAAIRRRSSGATTSS